MRYGSQRIVGPFCGPRQGATQATIIPPGIVTDSFTRADSPTLGANWTTITGFSDLSIETNTCVPSAVSTQCAAYWSANNFLGDQSSQVTVTGTFPGNSFFVGPVVRAQASSQSMYVMYVNLDPGSHTFQIFRWDAGSSGLIANFGTIALSPGDTIKLEAVGVTLIGYKNGASIGNVVDTTYVSGSPGLNLFDDTSASHHCVINWVGVGVAV